MYVPCCSRSKVEAVYTCPVIELILSHFLTSPSKEYLWKEIGKKSHILFQIRRKCWQSTYFFFYFRQASWLQLYSKRGFLGEYQYYSHPGETDRGREAKIFDNKSASRTIGMPPLLQPVYCNSTFFLIGKPGVFMSFWSKSALCPSPMSLSLHCISHVLVLMGVQAKGWGAEGEVQPGTLFWISKGPGSRDGLQWLSAASLEQPVITIRAALEQRVL